MTATGRYMLAAAVAAGLTSWAVAQRARVPHEDVPSPRAGANDLTIGDAAIPSAIAAGDRWLPKPAAAADVGTAPARRTEAAPDRQTDFAAPGTYASVFNPDVVPYKRVSAFDSLDAQFTMRVARNALTPSPIGGTTDGSRDRFWADVRVELNGSQPASLPSVAPDMRILSVEVTPPTELLFWRDAADNFAVTAVDPTVRGPRRIVFVADADARYFAAEGAPALSAAQLAALAPAQFRPSLTSNVQAEADRALRSLGLTPHQPLTISLPRLVEVFRSFEQKPLKGQRTSLFRDLIEERVGVCRHRAFAFLVVASALGIPTRAVENEAHAFVEVWLGSYWQRIDLGGATADMNVVGGQDRTLHRPRASDPFPKPAEFRATDERGGLPEGVRGLSSSQLEARTAPTHSAPASGDAPAAVPTTSVGEGLDPNLPTPLVTLTIDARRAYRGEALHVRGSVTLSGQPLGGVPVDIFLLPLRGGDPLYVGRTLAADGQFASLLALPPSTPLLRYEVIASVPGGAAYNPGRSP